MVNLSMVTCLIDVGNYVVGANHFLWDDGFYIRDDIGPGTYYIQSEHLLWGHVSPCALHNPCIAGHCVYKLFGRLRSSNSSFE